MKNYKVNIDKPKPTQEEILAGRNFDAVLAQYKAAPGKVIKKPFWQTGGFITSVVAVAATVTIAVLVMSGQGEQNISDPANPGIADNGAVQPAQNENTADAQWTPTKRKIAPPLAGVNIPYQNYKVSAKWGGSISYPTGTKVTFKPNSFVDKNGNPVNGNVDVQYREMHDAVDFFLSGVPLEYDSAGQTYQFESAGMLEVAAFVNGEVVYLDKNKPMEVKMASVAEGTKYNLYQFDTIAGNWVYQGKDKVAPLPYDPEQRAKDSLEARAMWLAQQPAQPSFEEHVKEMPKDAVKPVKADPRKNRFVVDFNKEEFPEMASYQNVIFEVDESKQKFDHANYNITWESMALSRGDAESQYKLTLQKGLKSVKLDVYPVLDGKEYDDAYARYQKDHEKFLADSASFMEFVEGWGHDVQVAQLNEFKFNPDAFRHLKYDKSSAMMAYDVERTFSLSGFGVYNMDSPEYLPQGSVLNLTINGPDNQIFSGYTSIFHVDRQKNTLMNYHNMNPVAGFHVNTKSANLLWAVKEGELYYAENESFSTLPLTGKASVTLKKVAKKLNTADEMRAFFHLRAPGAAH